MSDKNQKRGVPMWKAARIASRVPAIHKEHKHRSESLLAFEPLLLPAAAAFLGLHDSVVSLEVQASVARVALGDITEGAVRTMREWNAHLVRDLPDFDAARFVGRQVPTDVARHCRQMAELAATLPAGQFPYAEALVRGLTAKADSVEGAWQTSRALSSRLQEEREQARVASDTLNDHLVAYRKALRLVIGTHHPDYRALRHRNVRKDPVAVPATESAHADEAATEAPNTDAPVAASQTDAEVPDTDAPVSAGQADTDDIRRVPHDSEAA